MSFELPLIFLGGLLGSTHCVGMCGPFAITLALRTNGWRHNLVRQTAYTAGRVFTYAIAGGVAGFLGAKLARSAATWGNVSGWLAIAAGAALILQGLWSAGVLPRLQRTAAPCLAAGFFRAFLPGSDLTRAFMAGMMTGFLPCGLLYAYLMLAASSGGAGAGMLLMAAFAVGTAPLLTLTALGGGALSAVFRRRLIRIAALCVIATGALSVARGVTALGKPASARCPLCAPSATVAGRPVVH